jgi:hypothetical protein
MTPELHSFVVSCVVHNIAGLELCSCLTFTLPDPVLHGTMDCYSGNHLVTNCPFFYNIALQHSFDFDSTNHLNHLTTASLTTA